VKQIYWIYSYDAGWVTRERDKLIGQLLPREMRDENLREFYASNRALRLGDILPDILGELSTIPFLPDSRRVVVVHDLGDFTGSKKKKSKEEKQEEGRKKLSPVQTLAAFADRDLSATENVLILSTILEPERGHYIEKGNALAAFLEKSPLAEIRRPPQKETDPIFQLTEALMERRTLACLGFFRRIYSDDNRSRIFREILKTVRLAQQAKVLGMLEEKGKSRNILENYLPEDKELNLYKQHPFVQKKHRAGAANYRVDELMHAMERLLDLNRALYPSRTDTYVPDIRLLFETFLIELSEGKKGAGRN